MNIINNTFLKPMTDSQLKFPLLIVALLLLFVLSFSNAQAYDKTSDFKVVAYHVDLRVQVMPMPTLKALATEVAALGFNTIIMEWEATYPYKKHSIISNRYAYTPAEITDFIKHSESLGLDIIPLQHNFGHAEYILMHPRYAYLRAQKSVTKAHKDYSQVDPTKLDEARELFTELYADILSTHKSKYVHIGGDETRILDCNNCKKAWGKDGEKLGTSKLYVNYMKMIAEIVTAQGKIPLLWSDMIQKHPEAIVDMPKNVIYIDWNYGWAHDKFTTPSVDLIKKHGLTFWGASSIRSKPDDFHMTSWNYHMNNQADYIPYAREAGFKGIVLTSWSTSGVYGYNWAYPMNEVVEIFPVRQAYPNAYPNDGFRMNVKAFIAALNPDNPLVPKDFAEQYAQERFGLPAQQAADLWAILSSSSLNEVVAIGSKEYSGVKALTDKERHVDESLAAVRKLQSQLYKIVPQRNQQEFAHYQMQVDFREFYLSFRQIQDSVQSTSFTEKDRVVAVQQLKQLLTRADMLNKRFRKLFAGALYDSEITKLGEHRNAKIEYLLQRLSKQR